MGDERVHVPRVYWDLTRDGVITEERIRGIKVDDVRALDASGLDRVKVSRTFVDAYLSMVFVSGFFHADPHPGNVFVERDGRVAFVDFGMVGSMTTTTGRGLGMLLLAVISADPGKMADGLLGLGIADDDIDRAKLEPDLARLLERYSHLPLEQLHLGPLIAEVMSVVRAHRLRLPSDLALLLKTVMMCEGVAARTGPGVRTHPAPRAVCRGAGPRQSGSRQPGPRQPGPRRPGLSLVAAKPLSIGEGLSCERFC